MTSVAPFGAWPSPITAEMLATTTIVDDHGVTVDQTVVEV